MSTMVLAAANPLLPNATFFVELIIFVVVLFLLWRYIYPPIQKAMADRQKMARKQHEENEQATQRFSEAQARYREALTEARNESAKIRDDARAEGQRIIDEMREQANSEVARIRQGADEQLATQREEAAEQLRAHIGELSSALAGRVIGEDLTSSSRSETVEEFLRDRSLAERSSGGGA